VWPVERSVCLSLGTRHIECGVALGRRWLEGSQASFPLAESGELRCLQEALDLARENLAKALAASGQGKLKTVRVRVLVAERWLSLASVPWSPVLSQRAAVASYVSAHLSATGIALNAGDRLRLNDAPWRQPVLVAAYPSALLELLKGFAIQLGGKLESVLPAGVSAVTGVCRRLPSPAVVAVLEGGEVSFWRRQGGQMLLVAPMAGTVNATADLIQAWQRAQLRDPRLAGMSPLHLVDIDGSLEKDATKHAEIKVLDFAGGLLANTPPALRLFMVKRAISPLDAVQRRPSNGPLQIGMAVVLSAMAVALLFQWGRLSSTLESEREQLASRAPAVKQATQTLSKGEIERVRAVNIAIRQLNLPVGPLMQAMQPPRDIAVALLGVAFTPGGEKGSDSLVKLTAETRSSIDMARYVAFLAERRPFVGAYLVSHEVVETDALKPYRFTVEAKWRE